MSAIDRKEFDPIEDVLAGRLPQPPPGVPYLDHLYRLGWSPEPDPEPDPPLSERHRDPMGYRLRMFATDENGDFIDNSFSAMAYRAGFLTPMAPDEKLLPPELLAHWRRSQQRFSAERVLIAVCAPLAAPLALVYGALTALATRSSPPAALWTAAGLARLCVVEVFQIWLFVQLLYPGDPATAWTDLPGYIVEHPVAAAAYFVPTAALRWFALSRTEGVPATLRLWLTAVAFPVSFLYGLLFQWWFWTLLPWLYEAARSLLSS